MHEASLEENCQRAPGHRKLGTNKERLVRSSLPQAGQVSHRMTAVRRVRFEADSLLDAAEEQIVRSEYARSKLDLPWDGEVERP